MTASYVTVSELRTTLGIGSLYENSVIEEVCQTAEDLLNSFLWFDSAPVVGTMIYSNVVTMGLTLPTQFVTGQSVTISGSGSTYNGTYTITGTIPYTTNSVNTFVWPFGLQNMGLNNIAYIQYAKTASDDPWHQVRPYGKAIITTDTKTTAYAALGGVREAASMLAVSIWQARQVPTAGGMGLDMQPSPFRMGNGLMGTIRGLIAPYMNPAALVG